MKELLAILFSAILVDNFVLSKFMGICPFIGVSKKTQSALGMSAAVTFVMVLSTALTYPIYKLVLVPQKLQYLNTMAFILIIALFVQLVEILIKRFLPPLYRSLGNCAVLGVTLLNIEYGTIGQALVNALGAGLGFTLALVLFSGVRERIEVADVPAMFKGVPAALVAAGIVAASFMGFSGLVENLFG